MTDAIETGVKSFLTGAGFATAASLIAIAFGWEFHFGKKQK